MPGPADAARPESGVTDVSAPCGIARGRVDDGIGVFREAHRADSARPLDSVGTSAGFGRGER
jgi:hypothetical protein